jgi:6-phosphogluconolactonase
MLRSACYLTAIFWLFASFGCGSGGPPAPAGSSALGGSSATGSGGQPLAGGASNLAGVANASGMGGVSDGPGGATNGGAVASNAGSNAMNGGAATGGAAGTSSSGGAANASGKAVVFVGGFGPDPVRVYDLDKSSGALKERLPALDAGPEPSCLSLDPSRTHLYICNEDDGPLGGVTAYSLGADGSPTKLNHQLGSDLGFTSVMLSPNGKLLAGAGYNGGSASVFPVMADGSLGAEADVMDFGATAETHDVVFDPTGKFLLVTTKGLRAVQELKVDESGTLSANTPPSISTGASLTPRHIVVHPNGKLAFVVTESGSSVIPYQLSAAGTLTAGTTVSSVPADYQGQNSGAHLELSHDGSILYVSNRGHDSVAIFKVDQTTGALTLVTHVLTHGASPHDFDIDAQGDTLVTANRKGNSLTVFKIGTDGMLTQLGDPTPTRMDPTAVLIHDL